MNQVWLRHRNGGGKKFGQSCEVDPQSYLDRKSSAGDSSEIYHSQVYDSLISGNAIISHAYIEASSIGDSVRVMGHDSPWPEVLIVRESKLSGEARVRDTAVLFRVNIKNAIISGDSRLMGPWSLDEYVRIHTGIWLEPPRFKLITGGEVEAVISECIFGYGHIGCFCAEYKKWFRKDYRQRIGKVSGWTSAMVEETYQSFTEWAR